MRGPMNGEHLRIDFMSDREYLPGGLANLAAFDARLQNVIYRNGSLFATHHVYLTNSITRTALQWWEVNPVNSELLQAGRIDGLASNTIFYAFPSIGVNKHNDVLIGYSSFASNAFPSANYSFRWFFLMSRAPCAPAGSLERVKGRTVMRARGVGEITLQRWSIRSTMPICGRSRNTL